MAIRIRPFFESLAVEIREAAILLFGDLCQKKITSAATDEVVFDDGNDTASEIISDALREQLYSNFFSMLLHLSENNSQIVRVSY